jgi:hypothetical protein
MGGNERHFAEVKKAERILNRAEVRVVRNRYLCACAFNQLESHIDQRPLNCATFNPFDQHTRRQVAYPRAVDTHGGERRISVFCEIEVAVTDDA